MKWLRQQVDKQKEKRLSDDELEGQVIDLKWNDLTVSLATSDSQSYQRSISKQVSIKK